MTPIFSHKNMKNRRLCVTFYEIWFASSFIWFVRIGKLIKFILKWWGYMPSHLTFMLKFKNIIFSTQMKQTWI